MEGDRALAFAAVDFLCCLILVALVLIAPPTKPLHPTIDELGRYAIDATWPPGDVDLDLWCEEPDGALVWFASRDAGFMSLEHDDLGKHDDPTPTNHERVIVRVPEAGEYVCNIHVYRKAGTRVTPVRVTLTRLAGADTPLYSRTLDMRAEGDEQTAFRFTLDAAGRVTNENTLFRSLVYAHPMPGAP